MAMTDDGQVRRARFTSSNEDEITDFMRRTYVDQRTRFTPRSATSRFDSLTAEADGVAADRLRSTLDYTQTTDPFDYFLSFVVRGGQVGVQSGREDHRLAIGDSICCPVGAPVDFDMRDMNLAVLRLPTQRLTRAAEQLGMATPGQLRIDGLRPVSAAMSRYWRSVVDLVTGSLLDTDSPIGNDLLREEMATFVAIAALHVFPNTAMSHPHVRTGGQVAPAATRRAVAYIDAHAHEPVTLADIANAAGVGVRALQYGFRRHLDTTPLGYLRRVRLEGARRALQAADATLGDTVGSIAAAWGFANTSRFATNYHAAFGELPGHTLRT